MVPYVRKSFWKHFADGVKYCQDGKLMGLAGIYEEFPNTDEAINQRKQDNKSINEPWA
jgi:aerobic-type carbon monoxide dehydrogenase small subunit (CoxS/CutS family)